ncbi:MAG: MFS transporter [Chthonomonadaceae bacterium]|nr:MFS transporter [Chthonomonadaceae bacterium]
MPPESNSQKNPDADAPKTTIPSPIPKMGRVLTAILIVAGFAEMAYGIVNFSAMPVYIKALSLPEQWIAGMASAYLITEGLLKSPFGLLGDRFGRKRLVLAGPIISTFTALLTPFIHNPYILLFLRVLDGAGLAALWPSAFSLIGDYAAKERQASAMSLFNISYMVGIAFGPAIGGIINDAAKNLFHLTEASSKQASFYVASVLFAATAITAYFMIPDKHPHVVAKTPEQELHAEGGISLKDFKKMLGRMPALLALAATTFLGVGMVMAYAKLFIMERFVLSESAYGTLLIAPALIIGAASIPLGTLSDKIGKERAIKIGMTLCTMGFWALILLPSYRTTLVVLGSLVGIGFVIAFPAMMAKVSGDCEPSQRGAALGAIGTAQGLGAIIGVSLSGFLYKVGAFTVFGQLVPEHGLPFLGCAIMLLFATTIAWTSLHRDKLQTPPPS